ncbi:MULTISPECIES: hypothetical protein [unclassified Anabaena]|uniref:hypothetical protein n=1 Tax=unclassified Anabaena TaxID=2619674 RepID=UPI0039C6E2E1
MPHRILKTAKIEVEAGDMLKNPLGVYEKAEEMAARYYQKVVLNLGDVLRLKRVFSCSLVRNTLKRLSISLLPWSTHSTYLPIFT